MLIISYIDGGYDPPTYIYECQVCKSEVTTTIIKTCLIFNKRLCRNCYKDNFCINHHNMLSPEGKEEFNQLVKILKKKRLMLTFLVILTFITWKTSFISLGTILAVQIGVTWYIESIMIFIIIFILDILIFKKKFKQIGSKIVEDKLGLFERQKNNGKLIVDDINSSTKKKICQYCGRELKQDAIYCDRCGNKL